VKKRPSLVDTNVILRYLLDDHPQLYEKAKDLFEKVRFGTEKVIILESVLTECVYVLMKFYKVPKKEATDKLSALLRYRGVANDDKSVLLEALVIFAIQNIDMVDAILLARARIGQYNLISFDKDVENILGGEQES
jgi:predicted nucleic-acid-binding protein